jgi:GLPGLI family protein
MKRAVIFFLSIVSAGIVQAQTLFHPVVKIEFEKVVYMRQLIREIEPEWYEQSKDNIPEKTLSYYDFTGDTSRSVYKPGREVPNRERGWFGESESTVYNDYNAYITVTQKQVFEETFLVQDSLVKITWKITPDTRNIAGFECRKAIGILHDSIAVFAFYTDEILVRGGPESIHGLPGMILGVGIPRLHSTWFATKVEVNGINLAKVTPVTKGKKVNRTDMIDAIRKVLSNWGNYGRNMIITFVI